MYLQPHRLKPPSFWQRASAALSYAFRSGTGLPQPTYTGGQMEDASKVIGGLFGYLSPGWINIDLIRSNSRRAMLDSPEMIALSRTLRVLTIGDGLKISSAPERSYLPELAQASEDFIKGCRKEIDSLFELTAESTSFDSCEERNLFSLMADIFDRWIQDGEVFIVFSIENNEEKLGRTLTPLRIALFLPEDVYSPGGIDTDKVMDGIERDKNGAPIAYYIQGKRIPKFSRETGRIQVAHLKFGQQNRGIPPFFSAIQMAKYLEDYQLSEVEKNALASQLFMAATGNMAKKMAKVSHLPDFGQGNAAAKAWQDKFVDLGRHGVNLVKVDSENRLDKIDTPTPSQSFAIFTETIQKRINMIAGMSRDIVTKDVSTSYSAARFQAQLTDLEIATYRQRFIDSFLLPLWENWFLCSLAQGYFPFIQSFETALQKKSWMSCEVIGRPLPDLSPLQEANALKTDLEMQVLTRSDICKMKGYGKWEDKINTLAEEQKIIEKIMGLVPQNQGVNDANKS